MNSVHTELGTNSLIRRMPLRLTDLRRALRRLTRGRMIGVSQPVGPERACRHVEAELLERATDPREPARAESQRWLSEPPARHAALLRRRRQVDGCPALFVAW